MVAWLASCAALPLDPPAPRAVVVYDPVAERIPLPNDLVRDAETGRLALPIDPASGPAEVAFRTAMDGQDGWSSASRVELALSAPVDPATVTAETIQVWRWGDVPVRVDGLTAVVAEDGASVGIDAPVTGWDRGATYAVLAVAGDPAGGSGLATATGVPIGPDAVFTFLRSRESLLGHDRAFPGETKADRQAVAAQLEGFRVALAPVLDAVEGAAAGSIARERLAAAWTFTVTGRPELAMDAASQRMPLPFDLLIDPATGLVSLPPNPDDEPLEVDAKAVANTLTGFASSSDLTFEATADLDPATVSEATVELWDLGGFPARIPASARAWNDDGPCDPVAGSAGCRYVVVDPEPMPLAPGRTYAVLVRSGITDPAGAALMPMAVGHLLALDAPIAVDGRSTLGEVPDADAARIEPIRAALDPFLDGMGRDGIVTAWTFTTLDPADDLRAAVNEAADGGWDATPAIASRLPPYDLLGNDAMSSLFPGALNPADEVYLPRVDGVAIVVQGTIPAPNHLDPVTRRWTDAATVQDLHFMATVPENPGPDPLPVVIFGHALVTDRRFVLTVSGELAKRGFVAIAVDFPYHGTRVACIGSTLMAVPNFLPTALQTATGLDEPLIHAWPCASGADASCTPDGQCLDPDGRPEPFASLPLIDIQPASGAAMLDVNDLPHIPDHLRQALVDLGALRWSLQSADWEGPLGHPIRTDKFLYAGQSLGGILGAVYVAVDPTVVRAVLNVPGADMVDLFQDSTYFAPQMDAFVDSLEVVDGSYEHERLMNVAHWLIDSVDPHSVAHLYRDESDRVSALIQMDRINAQLGDVVIPNATTDVLAEASGLPVIEYPSVLHGDLVIPLIGDQMLEDLADFLADGP